MMNLLLREKIDNNDIFLDEEGIKLRSLMWISGSFLGQGIVYLLLTRIIFIFEDKNTLDKNRLAFLKYNKNLVSFMKIFIDALLFFIHVFLLMFLGIIVIIFHLNGSFSNETYFILIKILLSLTIFYIFTIYGIKFIDSYFNNNFNKKFYLDYDFFLLLDII